METFYAWKHDINDTGKNASSYTPIRAKSIEEAHIEAKKHFKYDFFYSRFKVSVMSHDGHQYISNVGNDIPPEKKKKAYEAYNYFHDLPESMQQVVYDHYRNNDDDWRSKSKEELQAAVVTEVPELIPKAVLPFPVVSEFNAFIPIAVQ